MSAPLRLTPQHRWIVEASGGDLRRESELLVRWESGEPLQYVLGRWGFLGLDLAVDRRALIPRPETEILVETALAAQPHARRVLDLGTGSGAIALAVAAARPKADVWAVDSSPEALELARENDADGKVTFVHGDWYSALPEDLCGSFDLIVSNPPYVTEAEFEALDPAVREWEPRAALVSGPSGLECLEQVIAGAPTWMSDGGVLALECAPHQIDAVIGLCGAAGLVGAAAHEDLAARGRVVTAKLGA
ncbi:MAG: peptide chain release factor N(5)-glutamine methyltransferase [Actinobacteria bacterium]|nr:peptide chain release factor N(5)-glutamine methyltransferase [Actinomycetota bacterium]